MLHNAFRGSPSCSGILSVSSPFPSVDVFPRMSDWFHLQVTIVLRSFFDFSVNHLCVLLHGETQVAPTTFTVEDILLLVLGPELC